MTNIFKAAAHYAASFSWPMVQNYGMDGERCMCWRGHACPTPGKHPVHDDWLPHATKDEETIASWFDEGKQWNIGLPLGTASGLCDVEWDDEKSFAVAKKFGVPEIHTIGYSSSRGGHRLFLLDERLISLDSGVKKIGGVLEVRFGGSGKQVQSIIPPSRHHTGRLYQWDAGMSPDDVEPARMPEALVLAVIAACHGSGDSRSLITKDTVYERMLEEGERHTALVAWISSEVMRMRDVHDPKEQQNVLMILRALNKDRCRNPLKDPELRSIWMSQLRWGMKARAAGVINVASVDADADTKVKDARESGVHAASGLAWRDGEWWPGKWRMTVIHSSPKEFLLHVPIIGTAGDGDDNDYVTVPLSSGDWSAPSAVSRKILEATGTIDVADPNPSEWSRIWNGYTGKKEGETKKCTVRGLKVKLMDDKREEWPPAEQQRFAQVAGWLLDALTAPVKPEPGSDEESDEPHPSGRPAWVQDRTTGDYLLYFSWNRVWEDIQKTRKVKLNEGESVDLKRRILAAAGDKEFLVDRVRVGGVRRRYIVWTNSHLAHLENIAHPVGQENETGLDIKGQTVFSKTISGAGARVSGPI